MSLYVQESHASVLPPGPNLRQNIQLWHTKILCILSVIAMVKILKWKQEAEIENSCMYPYNMYKLSWISKNSLGLKVPKSKGINNTRMIQLHYEKGRNGCSIYGFTIKFMLDD